MVHGEYDTSGRSGLTSLVGYSRRLTRGPFAFNRLTYNSTGCTFTAEMPETKNDKPELGKMIKLRRRDDGVVIFYMASGEPRMGVREGSKTEAMFKAIDAAYADAVALEVKI